MYGDIGENTCDDYLIAVIRAFRDMLNCMRTIHNSLTKSQDIFGIKLQKCGNTGNISYAHFTLEARYGIRSDYTKRHFVQLVNKTNLCSAFCTICRMFVKC